MDKSWMTRPRATKEYVDGVNSFLVFAFENTSRAEILCPCVKCNNCIFMNRIDVFTHLVCNGFARNYIHWYYHGEVVPCKSTSNQGVVNDGEIENDNMHEMLEDIFQTSTPEDMAASSPIEPRNATTDEHQKFLKLIEDAEQELYPGCRKFTKLSFIVRLFHIKCMSGWSISSFTMLLELLKEAFPEGETLPDSYYGVKKIIGDLGLSYNKIHACPNDCQLYWKEHENDESCRICGASRWKLHEEESSKNVEKKKKIAAKVLRHFPLVPRLQRLFMSNKTASFMRWHEEGRTKDGLLRHPADSPAWKTFDYHNPIFASEVRNVRLGLASDGFNPFRTMSITHSTWPVLLVVYNLPPWMCMKQPFIIMSLLIDGPSAPGNDIDVYLQPLIDELNELWEFGIKTYDASKKETFQMHAALLWTINDFPAYANLSGWSTKGKYACPCCHKNTTFLHLSDSRKFCYMGHRRFLEYDHKFRRDKTSFFGGEDFQPAPSRLSGLEVLDELEGVNVTFGKLHEKSKKRKGVASSEHLPYNWKKKSIFFQLPYWKRNLVRHNLDVMHIEKNVCDNLIETLLGIKGKTKDSYKARLDLQKIGIREELHPVNVGTSSHYLPPACFTMGSGDKDIFCKVLKQIKVPDGYSSNISRCIRVKQHKILSLKSHDSHILMQQLLPLAVRRCLPKDVSSILIDLCNYFREICSKVLRVVDLLQLESRIPVILCKMERAFPPAFFDIMVHLPIHLVEEARLCGPVQYRWMYPIERYLLRLKSYVRNRSQPEGSIAEGYLAEECLTFCSRYLHDVETRSTRLPRNNENPVNTSDLSKEFSIFSKPGRALGKCTYVLLDHIQLAQAHRYVLFNCEAINPFISEHIRIISQQHQRSRVKDIEHKHTEQFQKWFKDNVQELSQTMEEHMRENLKWIAMGPSNVARQYRGFVINGFRFHTSKVEVNRKVQNSGVVVIAKTTSFSSAKDNNPVAGDVAYYGVLTDVLELEYCEKLKVVLFKCNWVDVHSRNRGIKKDVHGFTLVNLNKLLSSEKISDEPFILASQAEQVFYSNDPINEEWHVVIKVKPRDFFDMKMQADKEEHQVDFHVGQANEEEEVYEMGDFDHFSLVRNDIPGTIIPSSELHVDDGVNEDSDYCN